MLSTLTAKKEQPRWTPPEAGTQFIDSNGIEGQEGYVYLQVGMLTGLPLDQQDL